MRGDEVNRLIISLCRWCFLANTKDELVAFIQRFCESSNRLSASAFVFIVFVFAAFIIRFVLPGNDFAQSRSFSRL